MYKYDLIIVGGGTSGVACAYIAGKHGLKTLLIESNSFLGGSITSSLVIPAMKTSDNSINNDFFNAFYNELHKVNGAITYYDNNKGWFNPELSKIILDKLMYDAHVDVLFESSIQNIERELSTYIVAIRDNNSTIFENRLLPSIETKYIVDATGDAKICQLLNYDTFALKFYMSDENALAGECYIFGGKLTDEQLDVIFDDFETIEDTINPYF